MSELLERNAAVAAAARSVPAQAVPPTVAAAPAPAPVQSARIAQSARIGRM